MRRVSLVRSDSHRPHSQPANDDSPLDGNLLRRNRSTNATTPTSAFTTIISPRAIRANKPNNTANPNGLAHHRKELSAPTPDITERLESPNSGPMLMSHLDPAEVDMRSLSAAQLHDECASLRAEVARLQRLAQHSASRRSSVGSVEPLAQLQAKLTDAQSELTAARADSSRLASSYIASMRALENAHADEVARIRESEQSYAAPSPQERSELDAAHAELDQLRSLNGDLNSQIADLESTVELHQHSAAVLADENKLLSARLAELTADFTQAQATERQLRAGLEHEQRVSSDLRADASMLESSITKLESSNRSLIADSDRKSAELTTTNASLQSSIAELEKANVILHNKVLKFQGKVSTLQDQVSTSASNSDRQKKEIAELRALHETTNEAYQVAKAKLARKDEKLQKLQAQVDDAAKRFENARLEVQSMNSLREGGIAGAMLSPKRINTDSLASPSSSVTLPDSSGDEKDSSLGPFSPLGSSRAAAQPAVSGPLTPSQLLSSTQRRKLERALEKAAGALKSSQDDYQSLKEGARRSRDEFKRNEESLKKEKARADARDVECKKLRLKVDELTHQLRAQQDEVVAALDMAAAAQAAMQARNAEPNNHSQGQSPQMADAQAEDHDTSTHAPFTVVVTPPLHSTPATSPTKPPLTSDSGSTAHQTATSSPLSPTALSSAFSSLQSDYTSLQTEFDSLTQRLVCALEDAVSSSKENHHLRETLDQQRQVTQTQAQAIEDARAMTVQAVEHMQTRTGEMEEMRREHEQQLHSMELAHAIVVKNLQHEQLTLQQRALRPSVGRFSSPARSLSPVAFRMNSPVPPSAAHDKQAAASCTHTCVAHTSTQDRYELLAMLEAQSLAMERMMRAEKEDRNDTQNNATSTPVDSAAARRLADLERELATARSDLASATDRLSKLADSGSLQSRVGSLESQLVQTVAEADHMAQASLQQIEELEQQLKAAQRAFDARLAAARDEWVAEHAAAASVDIAAALDSASSRHRSEIDQIQAAHSADIERLQQESAQHAQQASNLMRAAEQAASEYTELELVHARISSELVALQASHDRASHELTALQSAHSSLTAANSALQAEVDELRRNPHEQELLRLQAALQELQHQLKESDAASDRCTRALADRETDLARTQVELTQVQSELSESELRLTVSNESRLLADHQARAAEAELKLAQDRFNAERLAWETTKTMVQTELVLNAEPAESPAASAAHLRALGELEATVRQSALALQLAESNLSSQADKHLHALEQQADDHRIQLERVQQARAASEEALKRELSEANQRTRQVELSANGEGGTKQATHQAELEALTQLHTQTIAALEDDLHASLSRCTELEMELVPLREELRLERLARGANPSPSTAADMHVSSPGVVSLSDLDGHTSMQSTSVDPLSQTTEPTRHTYLSSMLHTLTQEQQQQQPQVEVVAPAPPRAHDNLPQSASSLLDFLLIVGRCKDEKRTGWVNEKVSLPESVADHMFRMSVMALTCVELACSGSGSGRIDTFRAVQIALVHDLAEALVGDITPTQFSGVAKEKKHQLEMQAMNTICDKLRGAHIDSRTSEYMMDLWLEYEGGQTPTAKYVKNLDKLDMYLQAYEYQFREVMQGTPDANANDPNSLLSRLNRFYISAPETQAKINAQDDKAPAEDGRPQQLLHAVISELEVRRARLIEASKQ